MALYCVKHKIHEYYLNYCPLCLSKAITGPDCLVRITGITGI